VAQAQTPQPASSIVVKAAKILDVRQGSYLNNAAIWIEGERIKEVGAAGDIVGHAPKNARVIDLGSEQCCPVLSIATRTSCPGCHGAQTPTP